MYIFLYILSEAFRVLGFNYNYVIAFWIFTYLVFLKKNQIFDILIFTILTIGIFLTLPNGSMYWHEPLVLWLLLSFTKDFKEVKFSIIIFLCFLSTIFFDLYPNYYGILLVIISARIGFKNLKIFDIILILFFGIFIEQRILILYVIVITFIKYRLQIINFFKRYLIFNIIIFLFGIFFISRNLEVVNIFFQDLRLLSYLYFFNPFDISQEYVNYFFLNYRNNNLFFEGLRLFQLKYYLFTFFFITGTLYSLYRAKKNNLEHILTIIFIASFERLDIFYII